ncbi:MAG: LruC domain-containing protein [Candidatus Marinimicrobia bacterium]|nr:LruC domain-containing protein [Candidatus Neomarinimicrobiota bacterium]
MKEIQLIFLISLGMILFSCETLVEPTLDDRQKDKSLNPQQFNYSTTKSIDVNIRAEDEDKEPLDQVYFEILKDDHLIATGQTNEEGILKNSISLPTYLDQVTIKTHYDEKIVSISKSEINYTYQSPKSTLSKSSGICCDGENDHEDDDEDGVPNCSDNFPHNPRCSNVLYYPSADQYATLAFEDKWPDKGDYDFNDLVLDYQFEIRYKQLLITEIKINFKVRASGARYNNGFGIEFPGLSNADIISVEGLQLSNDSYIELNSNGTEANQSNPVIIPFDNVYTLFENLTYVNTGYSEGHNLPDYEFSVMVDTKPVYWYEINYSFNFSPFMIIDGEREQEVHLAGGTPTDLGDQDPFYPDYKDENNMPWALNFPEKFYYPIERADIRNAYLHFEEWRTSEGNQYDDWYSNPTSGYRDEDLIYGL